MKLVPTLFVLVILFFIGVIVTSILNLTTEPQVIITECPKPKVCPKQIECPYCPDWPECPAPPIMEECITFETEYANAGKENEALMEKMYKVTIERNIAEDALDVVCLSNKSHVLCN